MLDHSSLCVCVYFNMYVIRASLLLTLYSVRGYVKNKTHTLCDRPGGAPAPPPRPGAAISGHCAKAGPWRGSAGRGRSGTPRGSEDLVSSTTDKDPPPSNLAGCISTPDIMVPLTKTDVDVVLARPHAPGRLGTDAGL